MTHKKTTLLTIVAAIISSFSVGYVARDIIMADQVVIVNDQGKRAATLGHDQLGNGLLLLFDAQGKEIASIRNGTITAANTPQASSPTVPSSAHAAPGAHLRQFVLSVQTHRTLEPDASLLKRIASLKTSINNDRRTIRNLSLTTRAKEIRELEKLIKDKETEIAQLQRKYDTPVQEIVGVDADGNEVWLTTTRDLSRHLLTINRGDFIQWIGDFKSHTETRRFYTVDQIKPIDRPRWF